MDTLAREIQPPAARVLDCQCSPYRQNSAFAPITDLISRKLGLTQPDPPAVRWGRLEARLVQDGLPGGEVVPLLAPLFDLPVPVHHPSCDLPPPRRRQKTLETLTTWLLRVAEREPTLLVVEDLHWADPSTLEVLGGIIRAYGTHRLLTLLTGRPEFQPPWPLGDTGRVWTVSRLEEEDVVRLVGAVAGERALSAATVREIARRTDGVPLFVEELTKMLVESGAGVTGGGSGGRPATAGGETIPATLQDSLMARLDRLGSAKPLAQWGGGAGPRVPTGPPRGRRGGGVE